LPAVQSLPEAKKLLETSLHPDPDPLREQHGLFHSPAKVQGAACKGNKQKLFHSTPEKAGNDFLHAVGIPGSSSEMPEVYCGYLLLRNSRLCNKLQSKLKNTKCLKVYYTL